MQNFSPVNNVNVSKFYLWPYLKFVDVLTFLRKQKYLFFIFLVNCMLFLPIIVQIYSNTADLNSENRQLSEKPTFKISKIDEYPHQFETFFNDHFGLRHFLVKAHNYIMIVLFHVSTHPAVILGKDGWLFFNGGGEETIDDARGIKRFTPEQLIKIKNNLEKKQSYFKNRHIPFLIVIPANKESVYPEYFPKEIVIEKNQTSVDQLLAYLKKNSQLDILDLRKTLIDNKKNGLLYYKTDTHWNNLGAFFAYTEVIKHIKNYFPNLIGKKLSDYEIKHDINLYPIHDLDHYLLALDNYFRDEDYTLVSKSPVKASLETKPKVEPNLLDTLIYSTKDKNLPNLLVMRDSFGGFFAPFLSESFNKSTYIWSYSLTKKEIEEAKPDIVILEILERKLYNLTKNTKEI